MEEVGIRVKNLRYYKSQPWGFPGVCCLAFCRGRRRPYDLQAGRRISGGNVGAGRRDRLRYRGDQPDKRNDAGVSKEHCKKSEEIVSES